MAYPKSWLFSPRPDDGQIEGSGNALPSGRVVFWVVRFTGQGPDWRHNSCGVGAPVDIGIIDVYLDLITSGIKQIETLGYPMVTSTLDGYAGIDQFVARITQGLGILTDTTASMVKAPGSARCRAAEATNLDQQQFVMGAPAGQSRCTKSRAVA